MRLTKSDSDQELKNLDPEYIAEVEELKRIQIELYELKVEIGTNYLQN